MTPIRCGAMNHVNAVIDDFDQTVGFFTEVYGAQFLIDMPRDEWHGCLIAIGRVIFQLFSPHDDLLHARFGPHYVGIEYTVPDVGEARDATNARGIRIARELGPAFHIHPLDAYGVSFEFYDHDFHAVPPPVPYLEPIHPIEFWRDDHPLGITGLERYRVVVSDLDGAKRFFRRDSFVSEVHVEVAACAESSAGAGDHDSPDLGRLGSSQRRQQLGG